MNSHDAKLKLKALGINTHTEPVIYVRDDSEIIKAEGFEAQARVQVCLRDKNVIATLHTVESTILQHNEASLSTYAWDLLAANENDEIQIQHVPPLNSLSFIRSKVYGNELKTPEIKSIVGDLLAGRLSDIHVAMFLTATAGTGLNSKETLDLTRSMVDTGQTLTWPAELVVDKHCVGGLPGNRTTLLIVPIVAAFGLMIPKTSSRAITSPAGTADTMEVFAPVELDLNKMRSVVEKENGCIVWGGAVSLSPADDLLIRIERVMDIDSEGQLIASILSKKIAAGSNHLVIDMPIGPTAKVRTLQQAQIIKTSLENIAHQFNMTIKVIMTDGLEPVGRGIGPALEAQDVWDVLSNHANAPQDLQDRALTLAGQIIEFSPKVSPGTGKSIAKSLLEDGSALKKFIAICEAQGGIRPIPKAKFTQTICALQTGRVTCIDNRTIARIAKLAGAPANKASGVELLVKLGMTVQKGQPLYTIHADARGELHYALSYIALGHTIIQIEE